MIKCPNCGFSNDDNCTFCAICGSSVTQDDFYVHNTTNASFSVEDLTKKLISKDKQDNGKTKSFKKLDKATIAKEAAKIELENDDVKEYKGSSKNKSDEQSKKNIESQKDTSEKEVKSNKADKSTTSNNKPATDKNQKSSAEIKNNNSKPVADKQEDNSSKSSTDQSKENTKLKTEEAKKEPKPNTIKNKEEAKTEEKSKKTESNSAESNVTGSDIKQEENQSYDAKKEEIPDSAKGSTDGKLYYLLSRFFFDTKNDTTLFKQDDIDENCSLAVISYIPFLFFIPMIIKPCSGYLRYHGIQGLTMFLSFIALEFFNIITGSIFNSVFNEMTGVILTVIITVIINLAVLLLISIGIANAVKGAARELPIIGKYKLLKQYIY